MQTNPPQDEPLPVQATLDAPPAAPAGSAERTQDDASDYHKMLRPSILVVDDDSAVRDTIAEVLSKEFPGVSIVPESSFSAALDLMRNRRFNIVILDLFEGNTADGVNSGGAIWSDIWKEQLTPIIIHSAADSAELNPHMPEGNPFITYIVKEGRLDTLVSTVRAMLPSTDIFQRVERDFRRILHPIIAEQVSTIWSIEGDTNRRNEILERTLRRHVAATMDEYHQTHGVPMHAWEQYIHPSICPSLLTGDILRRCGSDVNDASAYRVVITPSCDLEMHNGTCKVTEVVTARCVDISHFIKAVDIGIENAKFGERMGKAFNEPHTKGYSALPKLSGIIPNMAVWWRSLDIVPLSDIAFTKGVDADFQRVASIDSPFREQLVWAFMQIMARPGIPERDKDSWHQSIKNDASSNQQS